MTRRSNGEGAIIRRQDGRWQASLQLDGRRRTVYGRTRAEAAAKLAELQRQASTAGAIPNPGKRTLNDLFDAWLEAKGPQWKPRTLADYRATCDRYLRPEWGARPLTRLTPDRIQCLYAHWQRQGKARTALKVHRALSQALDLAVRWGWLAANPCERVDVPRYHAARKAMWSTEELRAFLDGTREHWLHAFWLVGVGSGARPGELVALTWNDVDLAAGVISITKSAQRIGGQWVMTTPKTRAGERTITLPREATDALRAWRAAQAEHRLRLGPAWQAGELVFATPSGRPLTIYMAAWALRSACDWLNLPRLSPHGLRHLHASLLLAEGLPVPAVSSRLGHANAAITMSVYAHMIGQGDAAATEAIGRALKRAGEVSQNGAT